MRKALIFVGIAILWCVVYAVAQQDSVDSDADATPWMREENITGSYKIKVPKDMKLERQEGRIFFENVNEYVARKLYEMGESIKSLQARQDELQIQINSLAALVNQTQGKDTFSKINP